MPRVSEESIDIRTRKKSEELDKEDEGSEESSESTYSNLDPLEMSCEWVLEQSSCCFTFVIIDYALNVRVKERYHNIAWSRSIDLLDAANLCIPWRGKRWPETK